jgi:hypothetical protein
MMKLEGSNVVKFTFGAAKFAIVLGGISWALFGFSFALRYLYLSIGIGAALSTILLTVSRLTQHDGTMHAQIVNILFRQQAFSSTSKVLRFLLFMLKESALRLTYWPFELGLMAIDDRLRRAPNVNARGAIGREFAPRLPVMIAGWMLAINLVLLCLYTLFQFEPGGAFQVIVTICMYATIIWYVDFLFNPIEVQLRQAGTVKEATVRFVFMCVLAIIAVVTLVYTYRILMSSNVSLSVVIGDVLFAGRFDTELKAAETAVYEALSKGDFVAAWEAFSNIKQGSLISVAACLLFYSTIVKRLWPILKGSESVFRRTETESAAAAAASLELGAFDDARRYASELPVDHVLVSLIDVREAFAKRRFNDAYGMIERLVNQARRQNRLVDSVTLDKREIWFALVVLGNSGPDGILDLDFAVWSVEQPYLQEHDLAKFIVTRAFYGGIPHVVAFAHYLYTVLEGRGERAAQFRENVVAGFLIGAWHTRTSETMSGAAFEKSYLEFLTSGIQTEKAYYLLKNAPVFMSAPIDLNDKAFSAFFPLPHTKGLPVSKDWVDVAIFANLQSVDRVYVIDTMATLAGLFAQSPDEETRQLAEQLVATRGKLEEQWGYRVFERLGMSNDILRQVGTALVSVVK